MSVAVLLQCAHYKQQKLIVPAVKVSMQLLWWIIFPSSAPGGQPCSDLGQRGRTAQKQGTAEQSCASAVLVVSVGLDVRRLLQRPNALSCMRNTEGAGGCDSRRGWNATLLSSHISLGHWSQAMNQEKDILLESKKNVYGTHERWIPKIPSAQIRAPVVTMRNHHSGEAKTRGWRPGNELIRSALSVPLLSPSGSY